MPEVRHPRTRDDVAGHPPAAVTVRGENFAVADDGGVELPSAAHVQALAAAYDLEPAAIRDGDDVGTCEVVKTDGEVCGRDLPCRFHSEEDN